MNNKTSLKNKVERGLATLAIPLMAGCATSGNSAIFGGVLGALAGSPNASITESLILGAASNTTYLTSQNQAQIEAARAGKSDVSVRVYNELPKQEVKPRQRISSLGKNASRGELEYKFYNGFNCSWSCKGWEDKNGDGILDINEVGVKDSFRVNEPFSLYGSFNNEMGNIRLEVVKYNKVIFQKPDKVYGGSQEIIVKNFENGLPEPGEYTAYWYLGNAPILFNDFKIE